MVYSRLTLSQASDLLEQRLHNQVKEKRSINPRFTPRIKQTPFEAIANLSRTPSKGFECSTTKPRLFRMSSGVLEESLTSPSPPAAPSPVQGDVSDLEPEASTYLHSILMSEFEDEAKPVKPKGRSATPRPNKSPVFVPIAVQVEDTLPIVSYKRPRPAVPQTHTTTTLQPSACQSNITECFVETFSDHETRKESSVSLRSSQGLLPPCCCCCPHCYAPQKQGETEPYYQPMYYNEQRQQEPTTTTAHDRYESKELPRYHDALEENSAAPSPEKRYGVSIVCEY